MAKVATSVSNQNVSLANHRAVTASYLLMRANKLILTNSNKSHMDNLKLLGEVSCCNVQLKVYCEGPHLWTDTGSVAHSR